MQNRGFVPGKLKLKKSKPSATKPTEKEREKREKTKPAEPEPETGDGEVELTEAEAKFLAIRNSYKKRVIETRASVSYQEQTEQFNEHLKSYPMHDDLEGK